MLKIGWHLSSSLGYEHMIDEALGAKASTFQFFTRNPRGGKAKELDMNDINRFLEKAKSNSFQPIMAHASYTINPASDNLKTRQFALETMQDDLNRLEKTPNQLYNFHPGSHVGQGVTQGITYIAELLNASLKESQTTQTLLETMSGKGSEIGSRFEEIKDIINQVQLSDKLGVCLDTCHVYSAGYDIVNDLDGVLTHFDKIIGLSRLKAIHLNDSMTEFNSHKDRHEKIGQGSLGNEAIIRIINHPALKNLPFILETPNDYNGYVNEINFLKDNFKD